MCIRDSLRGLIHHGKEAERGSLKGQKTGGSVIAALHGLSVVIQRHMAQVGTQIQLDRNRDGIAVCQALHGDIIGFGFLTVLDGDGIRRTVLTDSQIEFVHAFLQRSACGNSHHNAIVAGHKFGILSRYHRRGHGAGKDRCV